MTGETNLDKLLGSMQPVLQTGEYVFASLPYELCKITNLQNLNPVGLFQEQEGTTLILLKEKAEKAGLKYVYPCRMITLNIHSSLEAVGFLAVITKALAEKKVSVNAISAYYHDHIFVPEDKAEQALHTLYEIAKNECKSLPL